MNEKGFFVTTKKNSHTENLTHLLYLLRFFISHITALRLMVFDQNFFDLLFFTIVNWKYFYFECFFCINKDVFGPFFLSPSTHYESSILSSDILPINSVQHVQVWIIYIPKQKKVKCVDWFNIYKRYWLIISFRL